MSERIEPVAYICPECGTVYRDRFADGDTCGGIPVTLRPLYTAEQIREMVERVRGIVFADRALDAILAQLDTGGRDG